MSEKCSCRLGGEEGEELVSYDSSFEGDIDDNVERKSRVRGIKYGIR